MKPVHSPQFGRLRGRGIFLSASVPSMERAEIYQRIEASEAIEEAVVSLARAVFSEGGTLVFGGHPTISPLVAMVVREYVSPQLTERPKGWEHEEQIGPRVEIYQSEVYREWIAESTQRLEHQPNVTIHWTTAMAGESVDPNVRDKPQAPKSMRLMRDSMVERTDLVGMVCIGGMEGVENEAKLFHSRQPSLPIFALESTGGAAGHLSEMIKGIRLPEEGLKDRLEEFWKRKRENYPEAKGGDRPGELALPYSYVAQRIVADIIEPEGFRRQRGLSR